MKRGFALVEVVVALLVLEVAVVGVVGAMLVASRTMGRAERLERRAERAAAVVDSLRHFGSAGIDSARLLDGWIRWQVGEAGSLIVVASVSGEPPLEIRAERVRR